MSNPRNYRIPADTADADVPYWLGALAEDVAEDVARIEADVADFGTTTVLTEGDLRHSWADSRGRLSLYSREDGTVVAPLPLETPAAGVPTLDGMPYSWIAAFDAATGAYPELLLGLDGCVPQWVLDRWASRMNIAPGSGDGDTPGGSAGVRRAGVALTLSPGTEQDTARDVQIRLPFRIAADVSRFRLHVRNHNDRANRAYTGALSVSGIWGGEHAGEGRYMATPARLAEPFSTPADGSEYVSGWITPDTLKLNAYGEYLFSLGYTCAEQANHLAIGGGWRSGASGDAGLTAPAGMTREKKMPLDIWVEVEVSAAVAVGVSLGDSLTCGSSATLPVYDSYAARHALANGYVHQIMANHGSNMADWANGAQWKWRKYAGLSRPDSVLWAIGGNDLSNGVDLAEAQRRFYALLPTVQALCPVIYLANIMPRNGLTDFNATRRLYNDWLETLPGGAINVFDFAGSVASETNKDTIAARFNSGDNVHLNTAGYARNAAAITARLANVH